MLSPLGPALLNNVSKGKQMVAPSQFSQCSKKQEKILSPLTFCSMCRFLPQNPSIFQTWSRTATNPPDLGQVNWMIKQRWTHSYPTELWISKKLLKSQLSSSHIKRKRKQYFKKQTHFSAHIIILNWWIITAVCSQLHHFWQPFKHKSFISDLLTGPLLPCSCISIIVP